MAYGARMMGGGFGGATLHLIPENFKTSYTQGISNAYANKFGCQPDVFELNLEDGIQFI